MNKIKLDTAIFQDLFLDYLSFFEAIKTSTKVMHWGVMNSEGIKSKRGAHKYLDEFLDIITNYSDTIAEISQGILGFYITPNNIVGKTIKEIKNPNELCNYILENVLIFYSKLNDKPIYLGIKSETETFIGQIQKYNYLFGLCKKMD